MFHISVQAKDKRIKQGHNFGHKKLSFPAYCVNNMIKGNLC